MSERVGDAQAASSGLRSDRFAGLLLAAAGAFAAWESIKLPLGSLADPGPGYFPLVLAALLVLGGLLVAAFDSSSPAVRSVRWQEWRHALAILGTGGFAALAIEPLGYRLTVVVMLVFLLGVVERKPPLPVAAISAGVALGSWWLFATVLRVPLPIGNFGF